jgi:predicted RNA-binding Zn-ribbon protein involved in translation (DUF1610 family)
MKKKLAIEPCPSCGNNIEVYENPGEIRKCPFCRRRYIVSSARRDRKYLEEYIKPKKELQD